MAGNAPNSATFANAGRCLSAFRAGESPSSKGYGVDFSPIPLFRGADSPILKVSKADPGIHGEDGLGGVVGLPSLDDPSVQRHLNYSNPSSSSNMIPASTLPEFLQHLSSLLRDRIAKGLPKIHLAVTGPCTNAAIFYKVYPQLFIDGIQQVVVMGGTTGRGNRGPLSEFNILVDPEAASIIYNSPVKTVQVGLDVTHQALFTPSLHDRLLKPGTSEASVPSSPINAQETSSTPSSPLSLARSLSSHPSNLRKMVSSTLTFFAQTYRKEFGFTKGPPIHDMLVIAFISDETIFYSSSNGNLIPPKRFRVDVECNEGLALGATVVDVYGDKETNRGWGRGGKNVEVLESVDTKRLWNLFFQAVDMCEEHIAAVEAAEESKQS